MAMIETHNLAVQFTTIGAKNAIRDTQRLAGGFSLLKKGVMSFAAAFTAAKIVSSINDMANASARAETVNRSFERTFGKLADSVRNDVVTIAQDVKRSSTDIKQGLTSFQSFFVGLGFGAESAVEFSKTVQKASIDLASFYGLTDTGAQKRFISALAGSPEVLDQFGINLKQAAIQVELYNMGIKTTVQNTDELTKTQARLNIINRAMTANGILGDAARNVDNYANRVKELNANWVMFKETAGRYIIPILSEMLNIVNDLLKKTGMMAGETEAMFQGENRAAKNVLETLKQLNNINDKSPLEERVRQLTELENQVKNAKVEVVDFFDTINNKEAFGFAASLSQLIKGQVELTGMQINKYDVLRAISQEILEINKKLTQDEDNKRAAQEAYLKRVSELYERLKKIYAIQQEFKDAGFKEIASEISNVTEKIQFFRDGLGNGLLPDEFKDDLAEMELFISVLSDMLEGVQITSSEFEAPFISIKDTIVASMGEIVDETRKYGVEWNDVLNEMGRMGADAIGMAMNDSVRAFLDGEMSFGKAFKQAIDNSTAMMAADLAGKAVYFGILAAGYGIASLVNPALLAQAGAYAKSAGIFAAGASAMGGISAAIPNAGRDSYGRSSSGGASLTGQSAFGQVLELEAVVTGDQLRFVLQESDRKRFRRNG